MTLPRIVTAFFFFSISLTLVFVSAYASPSADAIQSIMESLQKGDSQKAQQDLLALANKHFAGLSIEGKTCRNNPAYVLMVEAGAQIRFKRPKLAANYLTQLQCLATLGNRQLGHSERLGMLKDYAGFKPQAVGRCPGGFAELHKKRAEKNKSEGKQQTAFNEAMIAVCLMGLEKAGVKDLLTAAAPDKEPEESGQTGRDSRAIAVRPKPAKEIAEHPVKPNMNPADKKGPLWLFAGVVAAIALFLVLYFLPKRKGKATVFISYRRGDSAGWSQTLHDKLAAELGDEHIFMDLHDIPPGTDFVEHLEQTLKEVKTVLVVIGNNWEDGDRIKQEGDWVRQEVVYAIHRGKKVIPVLVDYRTMPSAQDLPEDLQPMTRLNAITLYPDQLEGGIKRIQKVVR